MEERDKPNAQLIKELESLRQQLAELKAAAEEGRRQAEEAQARAQRRLESLWKIATMVDADYWTLCDTVLAEITTVTQSRYAFYGFLNEDESVMTLYSWSREAMQGCQVRDRSKKFHIATAGLWADAVRERRVLIVNDYQAEHPSKKGLPNGHVPLTRVLAVPIFSGARIVALAAVANKPFDYVEEDAGQIRAFCTSVQVILEHRWAEEALRRSLRHYEELVNSIEGVVWEADAGTFQFSFVSKQAERLLGYPVERWLTEPTFWQDHIHPEDRGWAVSFCAARTAEKRDHKFEYRMIAADGRAVWLRDIVRVVVEDDQPVKLRGVMVDITERKRVEEQLHLQAAAMESADNGIVITDRNGTILWVNSAVTRLTGYTAEEAIGQTPRLFNSGKQDASFYQDLWNTILSGQAWHSEIINRRKDGSLYPEEITITPVKDVNGEITHFVAIWKDITERKQAEEQIRRLASFPAENPNPVIETDLAGAITYFNPAAASRFPELAIGESQQPGLNDLPRLIGETESEAKGVVREIQVGDAVYEQHVSWVTESERIRTYWLDITERKQIQAQLMRADRLAAIGTLVSGVAHEVNNPLTGALGYVELLLRQDLDETVKGDLRVVRDETQRAVRVMRNLLSFAREQKPQKSILSINEALESTLDLRAHALRMNNVEVKKDLQPDLPDTMADRAQLQQVFLNIILNAEQAMMEAHGRGILSVETRQVGDAIHITIADDGPGIPEENLLKVFDPFFTTKPEGKGTGLGLSICYGIVQEHGGTIRVSSEVGKGATFTIELPVVSEASQP